MMLGNDIVDLCAAVRESNWYRKGWLQKLFTDDEQQLILQSDNKDTMIWLLWTMKEAAYKIVNREHKVMFFAPVKFACSFTSSYGSLAKGNVQFDGCMYNAFSSISEAYIHTIAATHNNLEGLSVYIRAAESRQLQEYPGYTFLKDKHGIPYLMDDEGRLKDVSKSHHGRFEAIVY